MNAERGRLRRERQGKIAELRESAERHGVRGPSARGDYALCCPFCVVRIGKQDDKFKLSANPKGLWNCYRCEARGAGDLSWLGPAIATEEMPVPKDYLRQPEGFSLLTEPALSLDPFRKYLRRRNVYEQACFVGVGACTSGRYGGRVIVPMRDAAGGWLGFSARTIYDRDPKYLYPAGMDRRGTLWGLGFYEKLKDRTLPAYIVEGVFDALPLFPQGLATWGKNVTDEQLAILVGLKRPLVVCLDGDAWEEGRMLAGRLALRGADDVRWCRLPPLTDPGTLGWAVRNHERAL